MACGSCRQRQPLQGRTEAEKKAEDARWEYLEASQNVEKAKEELHKLEKIEAEKMKKYKELADAALFEGTRFAKEYEG